jgi:aminopeptidase
VTDPRVEKLAELVVGYSLELREGSVVRIDGHEQATPLVLELYRAALAVGAHPFANLQLDGLAEQLVALGSDEQLAFVAPAERDEVETVDALVTIWSESNTRAFSRADPARMARLIATRRELSDRRWQRIAAGGLAWCGTLYPTNAHAQDADMSLQDYEDFVYRACRLTDDDPAAAWRAFASELESRAALLADVGELRILGPDTDLRVAVAGRSWIAADGCLNMPDGEVFTSPIETGVDGEIRFGFPAVYEGREIEDVRLRFAGGRVVEAEAARGGEYLDSLLDMDAGARIAGEIAFGMNYEIDRFTHNVLFDEKIGGTIHLALGSGFPQAGGANRSGLHIDLVCDLRAEGEVYADDELVWKDGSFVAEPVEATR